MASLSEIEQTYDYMDEFFRATLGPHADITGARYEGYFSLTLEQAQAAKHDYIFSSLGLARGQRMLDVGSGWGPLLDAARQRGIESLGLSLSPKQVTACVAAGLDARLEDWKEADIAELGHFDAIASVGAFEHFCSREDYEAGRQEDVYRRYFEFCAALLEPGQRMYLQTMTWGPYAPKLEEIRLDAPKNSNGYVVALLEKFYPGSYPPLDMKQLERCAAPTFRVVRQDSGREDYIQTMTEWRTKMANLDQSKVLAAVKMIPALVWDRRLRWKIFALLRGGGTNRECFIRRILDHRRIVYERVRD